jgi:hypothetical protein
VVELQALAAGLIGEEETASPNPCAAGVRRAGSEHMRDEAGCAVTAARVTSVLVEDSAGDSAGQIAVEVAARVSPAEGT